MTKINKAILLFPIKCPKRWTAIRAILTALPTAILGYARFAYSDGATSTQTKVISLIQSDLSLISMLSLPIFISILADFYQWGGEYVQNRHPRSVPDSRLTKTLVSVNRVVGSKLERCSKVATGISDEDRSIGEIFDEIARPEEQIRELIEEASALVVSISDRQHLRFVLVAVEDGVPIEPVAYSPKTNRPKKSNVISRDSFFSYVAKTGAFQVIEDLERYHTKKSKLNRREAEKRFPISYHAENDSVPCGSICGFPIFHCHLDQVVYVLTVMDDEPKAVTGAYKDTYGPILNHFFDRILLEHSIKVIKNHAC